MFNQQSHAAFRGESTLCSTCFQTFSFFLSVLASRRYLPVLKHFPDKYIYDPWKAPEETQKEAKCVIGVDYPKPMVNHSEVSRVNLERMKQIYQHFFCNRDEGMDDASQVETPIKLGIVTQMQLGITTSIIRQS